MRRRLWSWAGPVLAVVLLGGPAIVFGQERPGDRGESADEKKLRGRATAPTTAQIDASATLDGLLTRKDKGSWSESKGAAIEGYVIQVEREEDGDYHLVLAGAAGETDTKKWVVAEVTPAWQKKGGALSGASLRGLVGKRVRVTGWLYWEPDEDQPDPRGTRWEIHPATSIAEVR